MIMDGTEIKVGQVMHHIQFGPGVVEDVLRDGQMRLRFSRGLMSYTQNDLNKAFDRGRVLFWHNPILTAPPFDDHLWVAQKALVAASLSALESVMA